MASKLEFLSDILNCQHLILCKAFHINRSYGIVWNSSAGYLVKIYLTLLTWKLALLCVLSL